MSLSIFLWTVSACHLKYYSHLDDFTNFPESQCKRAMMFRLSLLATDFLSILRLFNDSVLYLQGKCVLSSESMSHLLCSGTCAVGIMHKEEKEK